MTASDGTPDRDGATVSEEGCPPHGIGTAEDFDWLRRKLRNVVSQQTPNGNSTPHGQTGSDREPDWVSGICDHCDDRSGPPIVDKETGRCTKCWADHEEISR